MRSETVKKAVTNTIVEMAVQTAKMPNQKCMLVFGKPKAKQDLALSDYLNLADYVKTNKLKK